MTIKKVFEYLTYDDETDTHTLIDNLPEKITDEEIYYYKEKIKTLKIGSKVTEIKPFNFAYTNIEKLIIEHRNTDLLIKNNAFYGSNNLKEIKIDSKSKKYMKIQYYAFKITGLPWTTLTITKENSKYLNNNGEYDFYINFNITKTQVKTVEFNNDITFDNSNNTISCFNNCVNLLSINIPNGIINIGENGFKNCEILKSIKMTSVTNIGNSAFEGCELLDNIDIPSVNTIGNNAFRNLKKLKSIKMTSVNNIGNSAFEGCNY